LALCRDDTLTEALRHIGAKVFDEPRDVVAELERLESPAAEEPAMPQPAAFAQPGEPLAAALEQGLAFFRDYERRVLGYVAYLGTDGL
jgi:hypothetical protein